MKTKQCTKCCEIKPLNMFQKRSENADGFQWHCKSCKKEYRTKYNAAHREEIRAYARAYNTTDNAKNAQKRYNKHHSERRQAKDKLNATIRYHGFPRISTRKCDCGDQAVHYHHHKGYARQHWLDVVPMCKRCHLSAH